MKEIVTWFQGNSSCSGHLPYREEGEGEVTCLAVACVDRNYTTNRQEIKALDDIIMRLFPERACQCPAGKTEWVRVVHFNNRLDTTRDIIDKIIHTYHLEHGEENTNG